MEEELNYVTVTFRTNGISTPEKPNELETIYEEVKTEEWTALDKNPVIPENETTEEEERQKAPVFTLLHLMTAGLAIICVVLASAVITLSLHFNAVMSEQYRENINLTAQNQQMQKEMTDLERQTKELTRDKDGLNWTLGVIMEYENFPVNTLCPQKECKPCLDGWVLFQSKCYLFSSSERRWQGSRAECRTMTAELAVIETQEEQEFINNHTKYYRDESYGYWIGLRKNMDKWMWVDGGSLTVKFWRPQQQNNWASCASTLLRADRQLANWQIKSCDAWNRYICETRALIKPREESAALAS